ncbi:MAG TPA: NUDIX domain-containing protein, partial [Chitinophagaceae bacterium]|nr:NUDIX domain-containing protein [Chitinophagaceae bacterium]
FDPAQAELKLLLVKRKNEPAKNKWALPGGFVHKSEEFIEIAKKKLVEETGVRDIYLEQLNGYALTGISGTRQVASFAFFALIRYDALEQSEDSSHDCQWIHYKKVPTLPFDHSRKVKDAIERIKETIRIRPIIFKLLPKKFPLNLLQRFYEELYGKKIDNRNFRRKIKSFEGIEPLKDMEIGVTHRPSQLYRFNKNYLKSGFSFDFE